MVVVRGKEGGGEFPDLFCLLIPLITLGLLICSRQASIYTSFSSLSFPSSTSPVPLSITALGWLRFPQHSRCVNYTQLRRLYSYLGTNTTNPILPLFLPPTFPLKKSPWIHWWRETTEDLGPIFSYYIKDVAGATLNRVWEGYQLLNLISQTGPVCL